MEVGTAQHILRRFTKRKVVQPNETKVISEGNEANLKAQYSKNWRYIKRYSYI